MDTGLTEEELKILLGAAQGRSLTNSGDGAGGDGDAPSLTINLNEHEDGERSANKGPCPCGYRHYLDGKEHDWVFKIPTTKGSKLLGYSLGDNPYIAAKTFVDKHQIGMGNEREYIEYIAQLIISSTASATPTNAPVSSNAPIFNPYASSNEPSKPAITHAASPAAPADPAADAKRRKEIEDAQNRLRAEKLRQEQEKEKIKERIRLDRENQKKEQEAKKKLEETRRHADAGHTPAVPRPGLISPAASNSAVADAHHTQPMQQDHPHQLGSSSSSSLAPPMGPPRTPSPRTPQFASLTNPLNSSNTQRTSGGGIKKAGSDSDSDDETGDAGPLKPKEEWTLQDLKDYLRIEGEAGLMARLVSARFNEQEIIKFFNLAVRMKAMDPSDAVAGTMPTGVSGKMPPPQQPVAFQTPGYRLGGSDSPAPAFNASVPASSAASAAGSVSFANVVATGSAVPVADITIDETKPKTQIQIRLGDGQRLVATFNHTHTIADIRQHINANRPNACRGEYDLIIQHPRKVLVDLTVSIEAAGLLKGVIIQTPK